MTAAESIQTLPDRAGKYFPWDEFKCHDAIETPYPLDWRLTRGIILGAELDKIRERIGPFVPTSVYRTFDYHRLIYSRMRPPQTAPIESQHLYGRAADIPKPPKMTWTEFAAAIISCANAPDSKIRYVKLYRNESFAHVDCRNTDKLRVEYSAP